MYFLKNYSYRYFHFVPIEEESKWCGGEPDYVLVSPSSIIPGKKDSTFNQVYVGVTGLRVRTLPSLSGNVQGTAQNGYYNYTDTVQADGYIWYKIGEHYIAGVDGVINYPKESIVPLEEMKALMEKMQDAYLSLSKERDYSKEKLEKIKGLLNE